MISVAARKLIYLMLINEEVQKLKTFLYLGLIKIYLYGKEIETVLSISNLVPW